MKSKLYIYHRGQSSLIAIENTLIYSPVLQFCKNKQHIMDMLRLRQLSKYCNGQIDNHLKMSKSLRSELSPELVITVTQLSLNWPDRVDLFVFIPQFYA